MAKLIFVLDDGQQVEVPLAVGLVTLGREDDNDVVIDDDRISRHHAELITHPDGRIELSDLGSMAGTRVNDRPVRKHIIQSGDKLAFGPLAARIDFEDSPGAPAAETVSAEEKRLAQLQADVEALSREHEEKAAALRELDARHTGEQTRLNQIRKDCDQEEQRLAEVRRQMAEAEKRADSARARAEELEGQVRTAGKKLDQLGQEQQRVQESLLSIQTELTAREGELAAATRRIEEASARLAGIEAQCQGLATTRQDLAQAQEQSAATSRQQAEARAALDEAQARLAKQEEALQEAALAETAARDRLAGLAAREKEVRATLESLAPGLESTRTELAALESRLVPLCDWKKAMDKRYARLGTLSEGSAEERTLWHEIEAAQSALFDLLPAARIETPGLTRGDFARISTRSGVPMKSDIIRRSRS